MYDGHSTHKKKQSITNRSVKQAHYKACDGECVKNIIIIGTYPTLEQVRNKFNDFENWRFVVTSMILKIEGY